MTVSSIFKRAALVAGTAAFLSTLAATASAAPILGSFNASLGSVNASYVGGVGIVDWQPNPPSGNVNGFTGTLPSGPGAPTYGEFNLLPANFGGTPTGSFLDPVFINLPNPAVIQDLSSSVASPNYFPVNSTQLITDFLIFQEKQGAGYGNYWQFNATNLAEGNVPGTPFSINTLGGLTYVSIAISGFACYGGLGTVCDQTNANGDTSHWAAALSTQYTTNPNDTLNLLLSGNLPTNSWSGTFAFTALPEPGSLALVGLALAGLGLAQRRKSA